MSRSDNRCTGGSSDGHACSCHDARVVLVKGNGGVSDGWRRGWGQTGKVMVDFFVHSHGNIVWIQDDRVVIFTSKIIMRFFGTGLLLVVI